MATDYVELVKTTILEVLTENGLEHVPMNPSTNILKDTPIDSMGLAIVVTKLEEKTKTDPFADGFILFQTIEELADLYAN